MTPDKRTLVGNSLREVDTARHRQGSGGRRRTQALQANPDAAYLLVQHAIAADQALHAAQQRIAELKDQLREPVPAPTNFLPEHPGVHR